MSKGDGCRCDGTSELWGAEADDYVESHLVRLQVLEGGHEILFRCPGTARVWLHDFRPDHDGITTMRLRWLSEAQRPAAVVERMTARENPLDRILYLSPEVEFRPYRSERVYRGVAAARRFAREAAEDPASPRAAAIAVVEKGDDAVVLGSVSVPHDGDYVEHRPAAWLVTVRDGKVERVFAYDSWSAARDAGRRHRGRRVDGAPPRAWIPELRPRSAARNGSASAVAFIVDGQSPVRRSRRRRTGVQSTGRTIDDIAHRLQEMKRGARRRVALVGPTHPAPPGP